MLDGIDIEERPVSSSAIRMALAEGQIADATAMLGGPWFIAGEVIHGEKRGRDLGYPTANIRLDKNCGLKHGIYAVRVGRGQGKEQDKDYVRLDGVASFGRRPRQRGFCRPARYRSHDLRPRHGCRHFG